MGLFRFPHRWPAIAAIVTELRPAVAILEDRDRALEDYLADNIMKSKTDGVTLDAAGQATITYATPFSTETTNVVVCNGDGTAVPGKDAHVVSWSKTGFVFGTNPNAGAVAYRVNWIATGR